MFQNNKRIDSGRLHHTLIDVRWEGSIEGRKEGRCKGSEERRAQNATHMGCDLKHIFAGSPAPSAVDASITIVLSSSSSD
jgi:hypothetical protein